MTDVDLDQLLRDGLKEAGAPTRRPDPTEVAAGLVAHRDGRARRSHRGPQARPRILLAAACIVAVATVATALVVRAGNDEHTQVVAAPPTSVVGPGGWESIDVSTMPALGLLFGTTSPSIVWTGTDIVVVGALPTSDPALDGEPDDGQGPTTTEPGRAPWAPGPYQAFAYRPATGEWRHLPPVPVPPDTTVTAAWTGTEVVVVSSDSNQVAAAWKPGPDTWRDVGSPASAWPDNDHHSLPVTSPSDGPAIFWTGERLLDATHVATWDPGTGTWSPMAYPADSVSTYSHLAAFDAVWDGEELVVTTWGPGPGLAWNATGTEYRQVPGMPADLAETGLAAFIAQSPIPDIGRAGLVAVTGPVDGRVLVAAAGGGAAASLDARTGSWRAEPAPPLASPAAMHRLATRLATIGGRPLFGPPGGPPVMLTDGVWVPVTAEPAATESCECSHTWVSGDDFLFSWVSGTSPDGPLVAASIYRPG